jgi:hypothetical protein
VCKWDRVVGVAMEYPLFFRPPLFFQFSFFFGAIFEIDFSLFLLSTNGGEIVQIFSGARRFVCAFVDFFLILNYYSA